ncbi:hypothetical protein HYZ05_00415 [Candidatus Daviesbacteria bacterium]|nr:hypothetical protein [Candidatus Daviesbacteria bacterium]
MADKEPPDLIGRIHGFLGMKPSEKEQAEIDRIKREGEAANAKLKEALTAQGERFRLGLEATVAAEHQAVKAELDRIHEQVVHSPKPLGHVTDSEAIKQAVLAGKRLTSEEMAESMIAQWDDGYGNIIYLNIGVDMGQIHSISNRITTQKGIFDALGTNDQTRLKTEFDSSKGLAEGVQSYKDYLKSDALGRRFQELQQKSSPSK